MKNNFHDKRGAFMESFQITDNFFEGLENEISSINQQLLNSMKGKDDVLCSVEFIKIAFSENLLDDVDFLNKSSGQSIFKARHANIILRDMLEQVIEFIYLMKHTELITDYMGFNVDTTRLTTHNPIKGIHKLGGKRFSGGRKSVSEMAQDINEKRSSQNDISLYELYQLLSEECHNSYFFTNLDDVEEVETGKKTLALTEEQDQYIVIIVGRFMETYRQ